MPLNPSIRLTAREALAIRIEDFYGKFVNGEIKKSGEDFLSGLICAYGIVYEADMGSKLPNADACMQNALVFAKLIQE